jgi:tetratricopeptide (TPR) repeat protein
MIFRLFVISGVAALVATAASAQVTVFSAGASQATSCSLAARHGNASPQTIETCTLAINSEPLAGRDLAGTHVNRGVLYMHNMEWGPALDDLDIALSIDPRMGEALVNRGALLIAKGRFADGIAEINRGLALNPEEPERAYYNRALAEERLDNVKGAYYDYLRASELAPTWTAPQEELKRFRVSPKG